MYYAWMTLIHLFSPPFAQDMEMNCILSTTNAPRN